MGSFFASAAVQWWLRRVWDWGGMLAGWLGGLLAIYSKLPPEMQQTLLLVLGRRWEEVTLSAAGGFVVWVISQWRSFKATTRAQIVTSGGQKVDLPQLPDNKADLVEQYAVTALGQQKDTLIGRMLKWGQK